MTGESAIDKSFILNGQRRSASFQCAVGGAIAVKAKLSEDTSMVYHSINYFSLVILRECISVNHIIFTARRYLTKQIWFTDDGNGDVYYKSNAK